MNGSAALDRPYAARRRTFSAVGTAAAFIAAASLQFAKVALAGFSATPAGGVTGQARVLSSGLQQSCALVKNQLRYARCRCGTGAPVLSRPKTAHWAVLPSLLYRQPQRCGAALAARPLRGGTATPRSARHSRF